jgi:hypothetical protein
MNKRALKFLLLVLIGWYVAGPVVETLDHWDGVLAETADVARCAGGAMTLVIGGIAVALTLLRQLKARCAFRARVLPGPSEPASLPLWIPAGITLASVSHSPPVPLRI